VVVSVGNLAGIFSRDRAGEAAGGPSVEVPDDPSGELADDLADDLADELAEVSADDFRDGFSGSPVS
jgi:hypothetical protein